MDSGIWTAGVGRLVHVDRDDGIFLGACGEAGMGDALMIGAWSCWEEPISRRFRHGSSAG